MEPIRTCVGCSRRNQSTGLLRIKLVGGNLTIDSAGKIPGRGAWLHPMVDCLELALRRGAFARALRASGSSAGLLEQIEKAEKMLATK